MAEQKQMMEDELGDWASNSYKLSLLFKVCPDQIVLEAKVACS